MDECIGSTSTVSQIQPGVLLKTPRETDHNESAKSIKVAFYVEPLVLERLGSHPRIVRYLGRRDIGLLLGQASHGNLQAYIVANDATIDLSLRKKWCHQSAEAVAYIHSRGVVHADLRPENLLVHETSPGSLDLMLCDFGGAVCQELELDGNRLPNDPFYDPTQGFDVTPALDIFSLGSVLYTILTGNWPYRTRFYFSEGDDEYLDYVDMVCDLFKQGKYPDVSLLVGGNVIMGCWRKEYKTAQQVVDALREHIPIEYARAK